MYGWHSCLLAMSNPKRSIHQILATKNAMQKLEGQIPQSLSNVISLADPDQLAAKLGDDAVHQGICILTEALEPTYLADFINENSAPGAIRIAALDQVTDPHNAGAIIRSAVAFGVSALLVTERNSAMENGALAKAACGALEKIVIIRESNLASSLEKLKTAGFWVIGLDGHAEQSIHQNTDFERTVIVLGSEGAGLRRLTRDCCDLLVKLPMSGEIESLNVSNAAAITFYEFFCRGNRL